MSIRTAVLIFNLCCATILLSASYSHAQGAGDLAAAIAEAKAKYQKLIDGGGRYLEGKCEMAETDYRGYEGLPVKECTYTELGLQGRVYLLNPDAGQLAKWTVNACSKFTAPRQASCVKAVMRQVWSQSNAQFPVAGIVIEPQSVIGGSPKIGVNFEFRDGVTVRTQMNLTGTTRQLTAREMEGTLAATVEAAKVYARPIGATREMYKAAGGSLDVGASSPPAARKLEWLKASADAHKSAWNDPHHFMFDAWAEDAAKRGVF
jgi:hypothetical protein